MVPSRETARRLIVEHQVLVDGAFAAKPARMVDGGQAISLVGPAPEFVSRAGHKLAGALDEFGLDPAGWVCLDAGSSTGGFTDCLLQRGAAQVVAVDVGTNQLHERLRRDSRVDVRERTDIRSVDPSEFTPGFDLVVGDLSFISLKLVVPVLARLLRENGSCLLLIKPQFEAGRQEASKGRGVISDPAIWRRTVADVLLVAAEADLRAEGLAPASLRGTRGNVEFVALLVTAGSTISGVGSPENAMPEQSMIDALVDDAVDQAVALAVEP